MLLLRRVVHRTTATLYTVCTKPEDLTRADLKSLRLTLDSEGFSTQQLNTAISQMTNAEITADIISIIRRYALGTALISHEERVHHAVKRKIRFRYTGLSIEAVLDRLPTAEILEHDEEGWTIEAEVYGDGVDMWLRSQG